jgi:hypothetical protein
MKPAKLSRIRTFLAGQHRSNHDSRFTIHDLRRKCGFILAAAFCVGVMSQSAVAQATFTYTGAAGGTWNLASNWTLATGTDTDSIPDSDDDVSILTNGVLVPNSTTVACKNMTVADGATRVSFGDNASQLQIFGTLDGSGPTAVTTANIIDNSANSSIVVFKRTTNGAIFGANWSAATTGLRFNVDVGAATVTNSSTDIGSRDISVSGGTFSVGPGALRPNAGPATTGILTINNGGTLTVTSALQRTATSNSAFASFTINANGVFKTTSTAANVWPSGTSTSFHATSTVEYAAGTQTIQTATYGNLTLTGAATKTAAAGLTVNGNVVINTGATFAGLAFSHTFNGNWTNSGNFTSTGTATFSGGAVQVITGATTFNNLTLANTSGGLNATAASTDLTVNHILTMNQDTDLVLSTDTGTNTLIMVSNTAAERVTGGTGQGEVVGRVRRSTFTSTGTYGFGSPFVQFGTFTFTAAPTKVEVTMSQQRPLTFSTAVKRTYQIDVTGGAITSTTLRLHYRDDADTLNGNNEATLNLWRNAGTWVEQTGSTQTPASNYAEKSGVNTFSEWTLASSGVVPSAVKLTKFNAASFSDGVQLTWESGFEVNNLGYRLYREQNGKRTRVTPSIVAGSTLLVGQGNRLTAGYSYAWFDPQGTPDTTYSLEAIDLDGSRQVHGPISPYGGTRNGVSPKRQQALLLNELGKSLAANSGGADGAGWPASMPAAARSETLKLKPQSLAAQQAIAGGNAVKLQVRQAGWYRVTQPELVAAGFDPSSDARLLQLYVDGEEVPVRLSAEGARLNASDTLEFYGVALDTQTTDTRTYWLVNSTTPGKRISAKRNKIKPGDQNWTESPGLRSFAFTAERREKLIYSPRLLNGDAENIFGALIFTDPTEQTLAVKSFDREAATPVQLEVALQGLTAQGHEVRIMLNGADLGSMTFAAAAHSTATFAVNRALLHEGDNTVSLASAAGDSDISFVDYVRLTYAHQYTADNNALRFSVPGGGVVRVDGFSTANIRVVDITDPNSPLEVATSGSPSGVGYSVKIQALGNDTRTLMAFADDMTAHPASISANQPSNWNASTNGADLVIITHKDFRQAVEPLATLRRNQGLSVAVVDAEDVYDEFSYGAHTPSALKAFLMNAAGTWARKPGYLLLVGDSSWDPRNFMDQGANDFVPTKLIDTNYMETASDDWLVDFTGQGHADMALGRLPGRTAAEVSLMVSKIMAYEQERELNVPLRGAVMVADSGFESQSAQTSALLPAGVAKQSLDRAAIGNDDLMRGQLLDALNQGPMIVNFYGHGSVGVWTGAGVLDSDLANTLTNTNRPSIYLMMTCLNGYAHDAYVDSLSESVLKAPNGGAVAVWASSGFTTPPPQFAMDSQFYRLLFSGQPLRLGEAARQAKLATSDLDVRRTWILLGDPTMRVR